jgi:hypothetical protein
MANAMTSGRGGRYALAPVPRTPLSVCDGEDEDLRVELDVHYCKGKPIDEAAANV